MGKTKVLLYRPMKLLVCLLLLAQLLLPLPGHANIPLQGTALQGGVAGTARLSLISTAEDYLGTPYRMGGLDRRGLDCSGLVYLSFSDALGISVPRTTETLYAWAATIPRSELQPGDLVFFVTVGSRVSHVGIYAGGGRFIHSASEGPRTGVLYSRLDEAYWSRTYLGAGRALPWNDDAARVVATGRGPALAATGPGAIGGSSSGGPGPGTTAPPGSARPPASVPSWDQPGFFGGVGAGWNWGGYSQGNQEAFRGFSMLATLGYKTSQYRMGLEFRPSWDRALDVFRLPLTFSAGTDTFQVFGGPAFTLGDPNLELADGNRHYQGGQAWRWETGISGSISPSIPGSPGLFSLYGELAWQPYSWGEGRFRFSPDMTANLRFSTGFRYLWRLGN